ncbi:hypothetical protein GECvBMG_gp224c [Salmonella phage GEC_vB_MG]|uniref:Uncharacterized protein 191 n=2 Tax=Seunavirus TaxID=1914851 RepID=G3BM57_9CAUD|nr:hypothetical protein PVP-SE1_gp191 [Salmonella phage PVPSE1]YP_009148929.1 hypothetical protein ACQ19_gp133 [Salmonella phage SSE121]QPI14768.1 hypothetical protein GECvBMG_gp224c [Salmonella phage GEC_vB_MG]UGV21660.1 ribose-phosphate pyrophosphokinase [Cronobacter phage EspYZU08]WAK43685.1 hypothetical protein EspYZU15_185 [Cronobacter phage EspYZU15]WAK45592.1 hypothetical protein EspYZU14_188 [Cronobacter phage EspYZU14]WBF78376.1 hypothetical protein [Cronobacter phage EspYZU12]WNT48
MQNVKSQIAALESQFLGKMVYHNYGQIGFGVVTGIDDRDPLKLRLRVKFTRHNTPEHIKKYDNRADRVRCLLPQSVTVSRVRYEDYNRTNQIKK